MKQFLSAISLVVPDYDTAIAYYVGVLNFTLCEDTAMSEEKRWVVVAPPGSGDHGCRLVLAKAKTDSQKAAIGNQTGGRVFLFLTTDDFDRDHAQMLERGVQFIESPRLEAFGKVAVFKDPFGNLWDFIERRDGSDN